MILINRVLVYSYAMNCEISIKLLWPFWIFVHTLYSCFGWSRGTMYVCFEDEGSELFSREGIRIHFFDINLVIEAPPGFPWFIKPSASQLKCHQIHKQSVFNEYLNFSSISNNKTRITRRRKQLSWNECRVDLKCSCRSVIASNEKEEYGCHGKCKI